MTHFNIIPYPTFLEAEAGTFRLDAATTVACAPEAGGIARFLLDLIAAETGLTLQRQNVDESGPTTIRLVMLPVLFDFEGYQLIVAPDETIILGSSLGALFYGTQTLRQLWQGSGGVWEIPCCTIEDAPRHRWRGLHLDVGRHMYPVPFIKKLLDLMALYKFNVFHWHLTEDQGWRLEIDGYPRLTEISAFRAASPYPHDRNMLDGQRYGGYYTQAEVREVVAYAKQRFITVVPEIEMPGHTVAVLAAYPELGCRGEGYEVATSWGIKSEVFCAGNEAVFAFLEDVLTQVMALFPSQFIHIGGDECPKSAWQACPKCQARIEAEGLDDEEGLQSYFIRRVERFLNHHDRRLIGWDEILEGGLAPNAAVMSWRGTQGGIAAATAGHDVVMSPTSNCYFDYYQSEDLAGEPAAIGGYLPLRHVYSFDPYSGVPAAFHRHILGGQGNIWTEYIPTEAQVEYMAFPRAIALAEALWSAQPKRDFDAFKNRLHPHLLRLGRMNVNYRPVPLNFYE